MDGRAIEDLRRLATQDEQLAEREHGLRELDSEVRRIRERAEGFEAFFAHFEDAGRRAESAVESAEAEVARRRREMGEAEAALAAERDEERRELARRALARAEDHHSVAEAGLGRARADKEELEQQASAWQEELPLLETRAAELSGQIPDAGMPASGAQALVAWASHAHAELFVAVRQLETERERVIREANELASALLGEPTYGSTVAQALGRVEHAVR
jgi:chromosome segregation ATPase